MIESKAWGATATVPPSRFCNPADGQRGPSKAGRKRLIRHQAPLPRKSGVGCARLARSGLPPTAYQRGSSPGSLRDPCDPLGQLKPVDIQIPFPREELPRGHCASSPRENARSTRHPNRRLCISPGRPDHTAKRPAGKLRGHLDGPHRQRLEGQGRHVASHQRTLRLAELREARSAGFDFALRVSPRSGTPLGSLSTIIFELIVTETTRMVIAFVSALGAPWAGTVSRTSPSSATTPCDGLYG